MTFSGLSFVFFMVFLFCFLGALCLFVFAKIPVIAPGRADIGYGFQLLFICYFFLRLQCHVCYKPLVRRKLEGYIFISSLFFNQAVGVLFIIICIYSNRNALIILGKAELKPCIKDNK